MTKWHDEKHKWEQNRDIPIGLSNENINTHDSKTYYCNSCRRPLIKLMNHVGDVSYYCDYGCANEISSTQAELELRSKGKLETIDGQVEEPAVTALPDPDAVFHNKNKPVYHGGIKALADRGLKIVSYYDSTKGKVGITRLGKNKKDD